MKMVIIAEQAEDHYFRMASGKGRPSPDIFDPRSGVGMKLSAALAEKKFNGSEVSFVDAQVTSKFRPGKKE